MATRRGDRLVEVATGRAPPEHPNRGPTVEGPEDNEPDPVGVFRRRTPCRDFYETVSSACRHHGFTGL
ncbi:MAG: hypothetical protein AAGF11_20290, partial [Myxococcota bacterium]